MRIFILCMLMTCAGLAEAAPSFDCSRAKSRVEKLICSSDVLQQLDQQMAAQYSVIKQKLSGADSKLLRDSQKAWLKARNKQVEAIFVEQAYRSRLETLNAGLIHLSFATGQLPTKIEYGNGQVLQILSDVAEATDDMYRTRTVAISIRHDQGKIRKLFEASENIRVDWNQVESAEYIDSVDLLYSLPDKAFVVVLHWHEQPFRGAGSTTSKYYLRAASGGYINIFDIGEGGSNNHSFMPETVASSYGHWQRDGTTRHLQFFRVDLQRGGTSGFVKSMQKTIIDFDFASGSVSEREAPLFEKNLETPVNPKAAASYVDKMNEILEKVEARDRSYPDSTRCRSLVEGLEDFQMLYGKVGENRIPWEQFIYAASKLSGRAAEVKFQDRMILLAQELMRYQSVIEETDDWRGKFKEIMKAGQDSYRYAFEYAAIKAHEGFPVLNQCEEFNIDGWIYGFWIRRYLNDQFELTGEILKNGLKALNKPYKFDVKHAPEVKDGWRLEDVLGKAYCASIVSDVVNGKLRIVRSKDKQLHGIFTEHEGDYTARYSLDSCTLHESRIVLCEWTGWSSGGIAQLEFNPSSNSFTGGYEEGKGALKYVRPEYLTYRWQGKACEKSELPQARQPSVGFPGASGVALAGFDFGSKKELGDGAAKVIGSVMADGLPVRGFKLRLRFAPDIYTKWLTTDASGHYSANISAGRYEYVGYEIKPPAASELLKGKIMTSPPLERTPIDARDGKVVQAIDYGFADPIQTTGSIGRDLIKVEDIEFRWHPVKGAAYYKIAVYSHGNGGPVEIKPVTRGYDGPWVKVDGNAVKPGDIGLKLKPREFYSWSVRAYSEDHKVLGRTIDEYTSREFKVE